MVKDRHIISEINGFFHKNDYNKHHDDCLIRRRNHPFVRNFSCKTAFYTANLQHNLQYKMQYIYFY